MKFYCYSKCSTCSKAYKDLNNQNVDFIKYDIMEERPSKSEFIRLVTDMGVDADTLFNTRGGQFKELGLKEKLATLSLDEKSELLANNPYLIKRPLLIADDYVIIGYPKGGYNLKEK